MIEGDIFTSLYEGHNAFTIDEITIEKHQAKVLVEFSNYTYKQKWTDEVILVNENGWKIDNVIFKAYNPTLKNTKEILLGLINS